MPEYRIERKDDNHDINRGSLARTSYISTLIASSNRIVHSRYYQFYYYFTVSMVKCYYILKRQVRAYILLYLFTFRIQCGSRLVKEKDSGIT